MPTQGRLLLKAAKATSALAIIINETGLRKLAKIAQNQANAKPVLFRLQCYDNLSEVISRKILTKYGLKLPRHRQIISLADIAKLGHGMRRMSGYGINRFANLPTWRQLDTIVPRTFRRMSARLIAAIRPGSAWGSLRRSEHESRRNGSNGTLSLCSLERDKRFFGNLSRRAVQDTFITRPKEAPHRVLSLPSRRMVPIRISPSMRPRSIST